MRKQKQKFSRSKLNRKLFSTVRGSDKSENVTSVQKSNQKK